MIIACKRISVFFKESCIFSILGCKLILPRYRSGGFFFFPECLFYFSSTTFNNNIGNIRIEECCTRHATPALTNRGVYNSGVL